METRNLLTVYVAPVSINIPGEMGDDNSFVSAVSKDGRYVLFGSQADDLIEEDVDTNGSSDVFVRDLDHETTTLVSIGLTGQSGDSDSTPGAISADGRFVAFLSSASDLVANDTNNNVDVFVRDLVTGETTLVSANPSGNSGNGSSWGSGEGMAFSADARYLVFESAASDLVAGDSNGQADVFVRDLLMGTTELVSATPLGASGNGASIAPSMSDDGRYVAFRSSANNLTGDSIGAGRTNIFVRDLVSNATTLVSVAATAGASIGDSYNPSISASGSRVSFESDAGDLVANDANGNYDVFVRDWQLGVTKLASATPSGAAGNGFAHSGVLSRNGRFVVFQSGASNLTAAADTNNKVDVFVRDLDTNTTVVASVTSDGNAANGDSYFQVISDDGTKVAFASYASNLAPGDQNGVLDVFSRDLTTGTTTLISSTYFGETGDDESNNPIISGNGAVVAFNTQATNFAPVDWNGRADVFARTIGNVPPSSLNLAVTPASIDETGSEVVILQASFIDRNYDPHHVTVNWGDGPAEVFDFEEFHNAFGVGHRYFDSPSTGTDFRVTVTVTDMDGESITDATHVTVANVAPEVGMSTNILASSTDEGEGGSRNSVGGVISANGRFVAFTSIADDLVSDDFNDSADVFLKDLSTGVVTLISSGEYGQADDHSRNPAIGADGRYVAFVSRAGNLLDGDFFGNFQLYVKDTQTGIVKLASSNSAGEAADRNVEDTPSISRDGRYVAFTSRAGNLVDDDTNDMNDVFVKDLWTGAIALVSTAMDGPADGGSGTPSISADGRYVAFHSSASNLVSDDSNGGLEDVFVKDLVTGVVSRVSTGDAQGNDFSASPSLSANGRFVVFYSNQDNLVSGDTNNDYDTFVKDLQTGQYTLVSSGSQGQGNGGSFEGTISDDGRYVAFLSSATNLSPDDQNGSVIDVFVKDLLSGSITLVSRSRNAANAWSTPSISANGRFVAFTSDADNYVSGIHSNSNVFVGDSLINCEVTSPIHFSGVATDLSPVDTIAGLELTWTTTKDGSPYGTPSTGTNFTLIPSASGTYVVSVIATDKDGGTSSPASRTVVVSNVVPSNVQVAASESSINEGDSTSLSGSFVDPGTLDTHHVVIAWGDTTTTEFDLPAGVTDFGGRSHKYLDDPAVGSTYNITVTVTDTGPGGGGTASGNTTVAVSNLAPVVTLSNVRLINDSVAQAEAGTLSADGRYVVFTGAATSGAYYQVFVKDLFTGITRLVSSDTNGTPGNYHSSGGTISADGRYIAFSSGAGNLMDFGGQFAVRVYVKDLQTGALTLVSVGENGPANANSTNPEISADGQLVAFNSTATNLVEDQTFGYAQIYLKNLSTGEVTLVTTDGNGGGANSSEEWGPAAISADGQHVAFVSRASNLVAGDTNDRPDVFVKNLSTGAITLVSSSSAGVLGNDYSYVPSISADGRYVAFSSDATNLVTGQTTTSGSIFVKDLVSGTVTLVSTGSNGPGNDASFGGSISATGQFVAFVSRATNLVSGDTNGIDDVFVKDLVTGTITLVSAGIEGDDVSYFIPDNSVPRSISADGQLVLFNSSSSKLYAALVGNQLVSAVEGGPVQIAAIVGDASTLDIASGLNVAWTVTKNGVPGFASGNSSTINFTPNDNGTYVVSLSATDKDGGSSTASRTITVANAAPTLTTAGNQTVNEGTAAINLGSLADPGTADSWTASVDWGDGNQESFSVASTGPIFHNHLYANGLAFRTVTVSVTDDDGAVTSTQTFEVRVNNVAPSNVQISASPGSINEGNSTTLSGSFADPGTLDSHHVVIAWGDTNTTEFDLAAGVTSFSGQSHTYLDNPTGGSTYTISVTVTDTGISSGGSAGNTTSVTVNNVAPTAVINGAPASSPEGSALTLTSGSTDVAADQSSLTYFWSVTKNGSNYGSTGNAASYSFTPNDNGNYVVSLTATDKDLMTHTATKTITVTNVAPTANAGGNFSVVRDGSALLMGSASDPAGANDPLTYTWDFDYDGVTFDGNATGPSQIYSAGNLNTGATKTIALRVTDGDGGSTISTAKVTVTGPATATLDTASRALAGNAAQGGSYSSSRGGTLSADGRYVVFESSASDLVPGDTNDQTDIFRMDTQTGAIVLVSIGNNSTPSNGYSSSPTISADGRYVAFISSATNLLSGGATTGSYYQAFRRDLQLGTTILVSTSATGAGTGTSPTGQGNYYSWDAMISANGLFVAFSSDSTNLLGASVTNGERQVFRRDIVNGITKLVSTSATGSGSGSTNASQGNYDSYEPSISSDGRYVAFRSNSSGFPSATGNITEVYRRDVTSGALVIASTGASGAGNNTAWRPTISGDGRYIAFESTATNLLGASRPTNGQAQIFLRDLGNSTTVLVSTNASGIGNTATGQGISQSFGSSISSDGRYVSFSSYASNLSGADSNGSTLDVFRREISSGNLTLVSTGSSGQANQNSYYASISGNGQVVAFQSTATNLTANDTNSSSDVFVKNLSTSAVTLASRHDPTIPWTLMGNNYSGGWSNRSVSADGRYLVFESSANNLVANDTNNAQDVFRMNVETGAVELVSTSATSVQTTSGAYSPSISADGQLVVFTSYGADLVAGDTNGQADIFVKNMSTGTISRVNLTSIGVQATGGNSDKPVISADGKYVAFMSFATNLVGTGNDTNGVNDVFLKNLQTGVIERVSVTDSEGQATGGGSNSPSISDDGRYVAFTSLATNLSPTGDTNGSTDIFRRDVQAGRTVLISAANGSSVPGNGSSDSASISADGRYVAFFSAATNLTPGGDANGNIYDVFRRDVDAGNTTLVSTGASGQGNSHSVEASISADGRYIAFRSDAYNLVLGDTNNYSDIFRRDLLRGTTELVSVGYAGQGYGYSYAPSISADGRVIAFSSEAYNLVPGDTYNYPAYRDIFFWSSGVPSITRSATNDQEFQALLAAVNALPAQLVPVTIQINLSAGTYGDLVASPRKGVSLIVNGLPGGQVVIDGHSPAVLVESGSVLLQNLKLTTETNSPTVIANGGSLAIRNSIIEETSGGSQPAVFVGALSAIDLGTANDPGVNTLTLRGIGNLIENAGAAIVQAVGNAFEVDGATLASNFAIQQEMVSASQASGSGLVSFVADTLFVTSTAGNLQEAIDAAPVGYTINVAEGGNYSQLSLGDKPLTLAFEDGPTVALVSEGGKTNLYLVGTPGPDNVGLAQGNTPQSVVVSFAGLPAITVVATGHVEAQGGDGNDTISSTLTLEFVANGGGGADTISTGAGVSFIVNDPEDDVTPGSAATSIVASPAPTVLDDFYYASTQAGLTVAATGVLGNDVPAVEGAALIASLVQNVAHGNLSFNANGSFTYHSVADFLGTDTFTYRAAASDSSPSRDVTVTIEVIAPPTVSAQQNVVAVDAGQVANNVGISAASGAAIAVVVTASIGNIVQTPDGSGSWNWSFNTDDATADQVVTITATDAAGGTATTTFDLRVNQAPVTVNDPFTILQNTPRTFTQAELKGNDSDSDNTNAQLTITAVGNETNGSVVLNSDGTITFSPASNFAGTAGFDYTLSDGSLSTTGHVTVTVNAPAPTNPTVSIADAHVAESGGRMIFTVSLSKPVNTAVRVRYATSSESATSSDFKATSGTVTFAPNQTSRTITVNVTGDSTVELDETFLLKLSGLSTTNSTVTLGDATATGTIENDDTAVVSATSVAAVENSGRIVFTVKLSKPADVTTTVDFATAPGTATSGVDYTHTSGRLTFSAGQTSKTVTVRVSGDSLFEADETFSLLLSNVQAGGRSVTVSSAPVIGTIQNDDRGPVVTLSASGSSLNEAGGTRTITARLDKASTLPVVVTLGFSGAATLGTDYSASATTITIPTGQLTGSVTLTGINDLAMEEESIVVDIVGVSGASESGTQRVTVDINESRNATAFAQADALSGGTALYVYGTSSSDTITITRSTSDPNTYSVKINSQPAVQFGSTSSPLSRIYVYGGAGNDTIDVGSTTALDAYVDAGSGDDRVSGGLGNDVLLGRDGRDTLTGRQSRDFLIGGLGLDTLFGEITPGSGNDQNILVGNSSAYDGDFEALDALMEEWTSGDSFDVRWQTISSLGGVNGRRLSSSTVVSDGVADQVFGGAGSDWFLDFEGSNSRRDVTNRNSSDRLN